MCIAYAQQCDAVASHVRDLVRASTLKQISEQWMKLAATTAEGQRDIGLILAPFSASHFESGSFS
jgi:hypothetical protein